MRDALAHMVDPGHPVIASCATMVETGDGPSRGHTYVDGAGRIDWLRCQVAVDIDVERFFALLLLVSP